MPQESLLSGTTEPIWAAVQHCTAYKDIKCSACMCQRTHFPHSFFVVYDNEKENWRILTDKEIYARVKNLL